MRTIEINYPGIDDNSQGRRCLHFDISSFLTFRHFKYIYIYKIQSLRSGLHLQAMRLYGQKCQVVKLSGCQLVKFDPWDMMKNFCFYVYAQKSMFIGENSR